MEEKLEQLNAEALAEIGAAADEQAVESARVKYLGRAGSISLLSEGMKSLGKEDKPRIGKRLNEVRLAVTAALETRKAALQEARDATALAGLDATLPGVPVLARRAAPDDAAAGSRHPDFPPHGLRTGGWAGRGDGVALLRCAEHARRSPRAQRAGYVLPAGWAAAAHADLHHPDSDHGDATAAGADYRAGRGLSPR